MKSGFSLLSGLFVIGLITFTDAQMGLSYARSVSNLTTVAAESKRDTVTSCRLHTIGLRRLLSTRTTNSTYSVGSEN